MSDGQTLFLILCLLYLFDCLVWIGNRTVLFVSPWCRGWHTRYGNRLVANDTGSAGILNPFPPLGSVFAGHWSPISISPAGVSDLNLRAANNTALPVQTGKVLSFEQISRVEQDEKWILLNDTRFARCASPEQATLLVELIRITCKQSPALRRETINRFIDDTFSKPAASGRLRQTTQITSRIRRTCLAFFVFLYILVPIAASFLPLIWYILPVVAVMWLMATTIAIQYYRAHRTLYPDRRGDRVLNVIQMALCPPAAIRACDLLSLGAMSRFHPVLTGSLLLGNDAAGFYGPAVRDLHYPLRLGKGDGDAAAIASWYADVELNAVAGFLKAGQSTAFDDCIKPPAWDGVSTAYCPRCLCQFAAGTGTCPDCPGIETMPMQEIRRKESKT